MSGTFDISLHSQTGERGTCSGVQPTSFPLWSRTDHQSPMSLRGRHLSAYRTEQSRTEPPNRTEQNRTEPNTTAEPSITGLHGSCHQVASLCRFVVILTSRVTNYACHYLTMSLLRRWPKCLPETHQHGRVAQSSPWVAMTELRYYRHSAVTGRSREAPAEGAGSTVSNERWEESRGEGEREWENAHQRAVARRPVKENRFSTQTAVLHSGTSQLYNRIESKKK